jgi:hypothetical protein
LGRSPRLTNESAAPPLWLDIDPARRPHEERRRAAQAVRDALSKLGG